MKMYAIKYIFKTHTQPLATKITNFNVEPNPFQGMQTKFGLEGFKLLAGKTKAEK